MTGRDSYECSRGHRLTPENTYVHPTRNERRCRTCNRELQARRRRRDRVTSMPAFVHTLEERLRRDRGEDRWMSRAKCREIQDPELFYVNPQRQPLIATDVVSFYCEECPVRNECLAYALRNGENEGIWGGLTAAERSDLKRGTPRLSIRERVEQRKALP